MIDPGRDAREAAWTLPLEDINPGQPALFEADAMWPCFERLRKKDPVHHTAASEFGPYRSITRYDDIMAVDTNHQVFSSDFLLGGIISCGEPDPDGGSMFIAVDPPTLDVERKTVSPAELRLQIIWEEILARSPRSGGSARRRGHSRHS